MSWIMMDVETDGPAPGLYSMASFGAVVVREGLKDTFYSEILRPLEGAKCIPEAIAVSNITPEQMQSGADPAERMPAFIDWLKSVGKGKPMFISDNNGFDWQFMNWYLWKFTGGNPFGHSSTNLGSLYKGLEKTMFKNFKHLRQTTHTHNPVDDAVGNAEALLQMKEAGLQISLD
ncbi:MAG: exonuclease [Planctomycetes bacterium]|nr:exonuclease [Planctomycetota bacterium]